MITGGVVGKEGIPRESIGTSSFASGRGGKSGKQQTRREFTIALAYNG